MSNRQDDAVITDAFYAGAYWGARSEPLQSCSERLAQFLGDLARVHPLLGTWYLKGGSRTDALKHSIQPQAGPLASVLTVGRKRRDDRSVIDELGFTVGLWNGSDISVGLMVTCGASSQRVSNAVVLNFPKAVGAAADLYSLEVADGVLRALVKSWEPMWATWTSNSLRRAQDAPSRTPVVGWLTYLAGERSAEVTRLTVDVSARPLANGTLLTIGSSVLDATEEKVTATRQALGVMIS